MMQRPGNVVHHELIGLHITIIKSKNRSLKNINGTIIDESRNMLTIMTDEGEKKVAKKGSHFLLSLPNEKVEIDGELLEGAPEKRIKKTIPKKRA
jgi:ribonuclease P protein subunit POP4